MGEVWCCRDIEEGIDVAVKAVRGDVLDETTERLFREEVLSCARLDHPSIAQVYDLVREDGGLALVMELRNGIPLARARGLDFAALRDVVVGVLEGLAYAHARGTLHLDIKPDNILVDRRPDAVLVTLLDFGIARAWRRESDAEADADRVLGTFAYMAPEQISLNGPAMGPWTDLYALGATIFHLCTGAKPFAGIALPDRGHRSPPRLDTASLGLPDALADLLDAMMAPGPEHRPTHAADVLHAMRELEPVRVRRVSERPSTPPTVVTPRPGAEEPTGVLPGPTAITPPPQETRDAPMSPASFRTRTPRMPQSSPSIPVAEPTRALSEVREDPFPGAYALFGLRELPVLGRKPERERIWSALVDARGERRPVVISLSGAPGTGKSRLARDAIERAHETGLAHTAQTAWTPGGGANDGLRALLEHALGSGGARGIDLRLALRTWCMRFGGADDERFTREAQLFLDPGDAPFDADLPLRVTVEALVRLEASRAVVVWLDGIKHAQNVAHHLVERLRERGGAIAVLTTERGDGDALEPDLDIDLPLLGDEATTKVVRGLLEMDDRLAARIAARSEGNPLVATQIIAELIADGALVRDRGEHELKPGYDLDALPASLDALWDRRLARTELDPAVLGALALARARVGDDTARRLVAAIGPALQRQIEAAVRAGLLLRRRGTYEWVHEQLREHLVAIIPDASRATLHAAAADALAPLVGREDVQAERAEHLRLAGRLAEACATMIDAIAVSARAGDNAAHELRARTLIGWAATTPLATFRARALAELAYLEAQRSEHESAGRHLEEAYACVSLPAPWVDLRAAQIANLRGDAATAQHASHAALTNAHRDGDLEVEAQAHGLLALAARRRGDREEARTRFERTAELARTIGDGATEARALMHLANMAPSESLPLFERALDAAMRAGALRGELSIRQVYADALYLTGDRERATSEMGVVGALARERGWRQLVSIAEIQLAVWALREGDAERAAAHEVALLEAGAGDGSRVERCMASGIGAAVAALRGETARATVALEALAAARGDYDEDELREVLAIGRDASEDDLAARFDEALSRRASPSG